MSDLCAVVGELVLHNVKVIKAIVDMNTKRSLYRLDVCSNHLWDRIVLNAMVATLSASYFQLFSS